MFTLKVYFVGLLVLSQVDHGAAVFFVDGPQGSEHKTFIFQADGGCSAENGNKCVISSVNITEPCIDGQLCWFPADWNIYLDMKLKYNEGALVALRERPAVNGEKATVPSMSRYSVGLDWLPSVAKLVPGPAPLANSCKKAAMTTCPISGRFWLAEGELRVCHFLHEKKSKKVMTFHLGGEERAIANVVLYEAVVEGDNLEIVAQEWGGTHVSKVTLTPKDDKVSVFVINESVKAHQGGEVSFDHFPAVYSLLHKGAPGRDSTAKPRKADEVEGFLGDCENELVRLEKICWLNNEDFEVCKELYPHGASECEMATIP